MKIRRRTRLYSSLALALLLGVLVLDRPGCGVAGGGSFTTSPAPRPAITPVRPVGTSDGTTVPAAMPSPDERSEDDPGR